MATGRTVSTAAAFLDPRFLGRESVRSKRIEAVLCAPVGGDAPIGVVYLQGRPEPGPFGAEAQALVETFARHLAPRVDRLLARRRAREQADPTRPWREKLRADGVIGRSRALAEVLKQAALVAPLDVSVLLTGESGTGKSQLARVIHDNGARAPHPFVTVNCAALPESLIESELFGALPGAHSTATRRIDGKVAAAERGTLFLDEVGELSPAAQAKLLHLLHAREYYPLGGTKPIKADIRVITATNADLQQAVSEKRFREDLFFRLHVLPIRVPTLAERREDIRELVLVLAAQACERNRLAQVLPSPNALRAAETAEWPGNVRELDHAVEAAIIRAAGEGATHFERSTANLPSRARRSRSRRRRDASRRSSSGSRSRAAAGTWSRPRAGSTSPAHTCTR
jgi:Nif-specific regulatory protein